MFGESVFMASPAGDGSSGDEFELSSKELRSRRLVGKGLCGIVYETAWEGKKCARKDFVGVPRQIFRDEALGLSRLAEGHINIVKTYGYTLDNRSCSLLLEYVDDDLLSFLQKRKAGMRKRLREASAASRENTSRPPPLRLREAVDIMLQIATGMEHLHENEIAHGDLKPRNVLLTCLNEGKMIVKVADFGLIQSKNTSMSFVSRRARVLDMAQWKAPEYLKMCGLHEKSSESDLDEDEDMATPSRSHDWLCRADVYSFGVTSFQILTGEDPFPARKWKEIVDEKVLSAEKPKLRLVFPDSRLYNLLESCWAGSPQHRPTFSAICKILREIMISPDWADRSVFDSFKPQDLLINSQDEVAVSEPRLSGFRTVGEIGPNSDPSTIQNEKPVTDWADRSVFDSFKPQDPSRNSQDEVAVSEPRLSGFRPVGEIGPNSDPFTIQNETPVPDVENYPVPSFAIDLPSKRKRIRKRLIIAFCPGQKHPSPPDLASSNPERPTASPIVRDPIDDGSPKHNQPEYYGDGDSEYDFAIPDEAKTAYFEHKWREAFAGIPSKTHHLAFGSVQFCKSKTRAAKWFVVDSCHALRRSYPSEPDIPPFPGGLD